MPETSTKKVPTSAITIVLEASEEGFGLLFGGAIDQAEAATSGAGVFISGTREGTPAVSNKDLSIGQQIISINGKDLSNASSEELLEVLRSTRDSITLELAENAELFATYTAKKP